MKIFVAINQVADLEAVAAAQSPFEALDELDKLIQKADPSGEAGRSYTVVEVELGGNAAMTEEGTAVTLGGGLRKRVHVLC